LRGKNNKMLEINDLHKYFSGVKAVDGLSFSIKKGELVGLIGPNGAGKTTVLNLISGVLKPDKGKISFDSIDITGKNIYYLARLGLSRTFQQNMLFKGLTCQEHIRISNYLLEKKNILQSTLSLGINKQKEEIFLERINKIIDFMHIKEYSNVIADSLPNGIKRTLGVAIAYSVNPKLLLLDEPAAGMSLKEIENLKTLIERLIQNNISILLVEHNVKLVMDICKIIIVISEGKMIAKGTPSEILNNQSVIKAYLGE
jgi:branched-chain amino acid transport system ATP-binding protein